jgi:uncharacterized protein YdaU (DUF1376 family)
MHYYKRNIGDYAKKAGRLTMLQHGAYTLLIDACYDREDFPTLEQAIQWAWATTEAEIDAVKFVLSRFFSPSDGNKYVQLRILEEILIYHKNAETNKRIAVERETKRKEKSTKREQSVDEHSTDLHLTNNHKPLTINQQPIKELAAKAAPATRLSEDWQLPDEWAIWAKQERPDLNPNKVADSFKDYWIAQPSAKGKKTNWQATWRNWVRNQKADNTDKTYEAPWVKQNREWFDEARGVKSDKDFFDMETNLTRIAK